MYGLFFISFLILSALHQSPRKKKKKWIIKIDVFPIQRMGFFPFKNSPEFHGSKILKPHTFK